jgi:hypothetical protein
MLDILDAKLIVSDQVVETGVGDETVLLHLEKGTYYGLDAVGTRIWAMLRQGLPSAAICQSLAEEFGKELGLIEADAARFLSDLEANGIARRA